MYNLVSGPLVWIAFLVFIGGIIYQLFRMVRMAQKDKVVLPYMSFNIWHAFPCPLARTVCFQEYAHALRDNSGDLRIPYLSLPDTNFPYGSCGNVLICLGRQVADYLGTAADWLTILVICAALFFLVRRWMLPEVRFVT